VCRAPDPLPLFQRSGKRFWSCRACRLVFVHDIYPEFAGSFDEEEYCAIVSERGTPRPRERRTWRRLLAEVAPRGRRGRLLEVGCGEGRFLQEAAALGWDATGVEILGSVARVARARGLDVRSGDLGAASFPSGEFDVAYMNEVIEHVVDPVKLMKEVRRVLRAGGVAILRTGNARSWSARLRGASWSYYRFCPHGHIRFFSPSGARALAAAAGFSRVECRTRGFAFRDGTELDDSPWRACVKLAQAPLSPLARLGKAGHRLTVLCHA
jgi:SAM-dependent methyltransferase